MTTKKLFSTILLLAPLALTLGAQGSSAQVLIDRELLFGNPEITGAQVSPDGEYLAFIKPWKNTRNLWVKKTEEPFSSARLLTTETKRPIGTWMWSRDGKYIAYVKDHDGDENFNIYSVDAAEAAPPGADAPSSRDLTGLKGVRVQLLSTPKGDSGVFYIGLNDRDKAWHDLYRLSISTGERTLIRKNTERISGWVFDLSGKLRLATRVADNGDQEVLRVDASGFTKVYSCSVFEECAPVRFHKDGKHVYMKTNKGDVDLLALVLFNPETGAVEGVESDPLKRADFGTALFSETTGELVATSYQGDERTRRYFKDKSFEADYKWLEAKLPGKEINLGSRTDDEGVWLVTAAGDTEPGEAYLFDR
ncbi:MAG TPA: hypothetical protein VNU44_09815, partial [Bryobacteraceae bacterium]|nr:hypothetical protein [Bryobacteraceae bacterium]